MCIGLGLGLNFSRPQIAAQTEGEMNIAPEWQDIDGATWADPSDDQPWNSPEAN